MSKSDQIFPAFFKNVFGKSSHHVLPESPGCDVAPRQLRYVDEFMLLVHVSGVVAAYVGSVGFVSSDTMAIDDQDNSFIKEKQLFVYGRTVFALPFYEVTVLNFECVLFVDFADTDTDANHVIAIDTLLLVLVQLAYAHLVLELVRLVRLPQQLVRVLGDDVFFLQEVLGGVVTLAIGLVDFLH